MIVRSGSPFRTLAAVILGSLTTLMVVVSGQAHAANFDSLFAGTNDFGDVGLLQTPTARMRADGDLGFGISVVRPYDQAHFFLQLLPWLETVIRYTDVTNELYSQDPGFSGGQHYKDKSMDFKVRLLNEGQYWPAIAVGVQDIGGTGLFSSEYFVSSYHWYDLDFSFGLAWGRMGSGGGIRNPFIVFSSSHFDIDRYAENTSATTAGTVGLNRLFTGATIGPFGGVEWITPVRGLALRLEYDGNDYQHEALGDNQRQASRLNIGFAYRGLKDVDMGLGLERGNTLMARVAIYTNFQRSQGVAKTADPVAPALPPTPAKDLTEVNPGSSKIDVNAQISAAPAKQDGVLPVVAGGTTDVIQGPLTASPEEKSEDKNAFVLNLRAGLKQQGMTFIALDYDSFLKEVVVWVSQDKYRNPAKAVGRVSRVLIGSAPAEISKFTLVFVDQGLESYRVSVYRQQFDEAARTNDQEEALSSVVLKGPGNGYGGAEYLDQTWLPKFSWDTGPAIRQSIGGPSGFYQGQLYWKLEGQVALTDHINVSAAGGFNIVNDFNQITLQSNSVLPHVRSDVVDYLQQGSNGLINLEADYSWSPYPDWYHRVSVGIFEEMYGGVATELLYRPYGKTWAVALDVNRVRQRGFDELFDFLPYTVTTGHATFYYQPDFYHFLFKLSVGQYLARDRGATIDVSREFDNGVRVGAFATKTNVSAAEFGEGSFDKGVYIILPLDLFFSQSTRREAGFAFRALTRDGGQMVYDGPELYSTVSEGQPSDFARGASELLK